MVLFLCQTSYIVHLLLKLCLSFSQSVDFVLLCLKVIKSLLVCLLEGFLLFGQLGNALILRGHLLCQVFHLNGNINYWFHNQESESQSAVYMKSLVPKCYKSILINLSKNVFSLPRKWQDENHYFLFQTFT